MLPLKRGSCNGTCKVCGVLCEAVQTAKSKFQWVSWFSLVPAPLGSQRISEGRSHVYVSSLELLGTTGKPRSWSPDVFQMMLWNDIASLAGMRRHGAVSRANRVGLSVCVFAQQSAAALSACSRAQGKGDSQQSPATFSKTLSQLILWWCCLLRDSTAHTACKFIPYLVLIKVLGQPDNAASPKFLLWMTLKEKTSRKAFSVAEGIASPACLISPCFPCLATTTHISTCWFTNAHDSLSLKSLLHCLTNREFVQVSGFWWKHWAPCRAGLQHFPCCSMSRF